MEIKFEDVEPILHLLNVADPVDWCSDDIYKKVGMCYRCEFGPLDNCKLNHTINPHLKNLEARLKITHPELFI